MTCARGTRHRTIKSGSTGNNIHIHLHVFKNSTHSWYYLHVRLPPVHSYSNGSSWSCGGVRRHVCNVFHRAEHAIERLGPRSDRHPNSMGLPDPKERDWGTEAKHWACLRVGCASMLRKGHLTVLLRDRPHRGPSQQRGQPFRHTGGPMSRCIPRAAIFHLVHAAYPRIPIA